MSKVKSGVLSKMNPVSYLSDVKRIYGIFDAFGVAFQEFPNPGLISVRISERRKQFVVKTQTCFWLVILSTL